MEEIQFSPLKNPNAISIILQEDGNYKAYAQKYGTMVEVRDVSPESVLALILTHK